LLEAVLVEIQLLAAAVLEVIALEHFLRLLVSNTPLQLEQEVLERLLIMRGKLGQIPYCLP
jgi:hypothetical protein